jgi:thioredoxin-like negative regulator of GroEL
VLDTLAMVLMSNEQTGEAVDTIEAALALAPEESGIQLHGALIFHKAGDSDRARQVLERLAASEDDSVEKNQARRLLEAMDREAAHQG